MAASRGYMQQKTNDKWEGQAGRERKSEAGKQE